MRKLEALIAARQQEEEEARLRREQEKETAIRSQQKEKVNMSCCTCVMSPLMRMNMCNNMCNMCMIKLTKNIIV